MITTASSVQIVKDVMHKREREGGREGGREGIRKREGERECTPKHTYSSPTYLLS